MLVKRIPTVWTLVPSLTRFRSPLVSDIAPDAACSTSSNPDTTRFSNMGMSFVSLLELRRADCHRAKRAFPLPGWRVEISAINFSLVF
jgi:hypothetical protein